MPKKSKKRKATNATAEMDINLLCSLTGGSEDSVDTMDSLLAEMEGAVEESTSASNLDDERTVRESSSLQKLVQCTSTAVDEPLKMWDPSGIIPLTQKDRERARLWDEALLKWSNNGNYVQGLLPSLDVELARHFQIESLSSFLLKSCPDIRMPTFERWLIDSKVDNDRVEDSVVRQSGPKRQRQDTTKSKGSQYVDPILSRVSAASKPSLRLVDELCKSSISLAEAERIVGEICNRTNQAVQELEALTRRLGNVAPFKKKGDRIVVEQQSNSFSLIYHRKKWKKPYRVKMNVVHYQKLQDMFQSVHGSDIVINDAKTPRVTHAFHLLVLCMLLRYSSLSGGQLLNDLRGGGMQGAIHPDVFRLLQSTYPDQAIIECFASPFNSYFWRFSSAFPDLDWHFGGVGDFFSPKYSFKQGLFEANPPFAPGLMSRMVDRIEHHLKVANRRGSWLTFVVIVPSAEKRDEGKALTKQFATNSFQRMTSSVHCAMHIVLPSREHGYVEGAQHIRPTRFKQSSYDTSVIVLQSEVAQKQKVDTDAFEHQLRKAFASRHEEEIKMRKLA